jgi:Serine aminopeptidase, S33
MFSLFIAVPGMLRPSLPGTQRRWSRPPAPEPCIGRRCHVPEPSHRQLSQEHPHAFALGIHDVRTGPSHADELGESVLLRTDRGDIQAILHQAPEAQRGVIWVGGAQGGFGRPGQGAYARLAEVLRRDRLSSLRLCYRHPNVLPACVLDIMAGIAYLTHGHAQPVVLVGHSFGGAVVMTAGALHAHVAGVVALAPQTSGATLAGKLAPRPLLVVHGKAATRLPTRAGCRCTTGRRSRNSWSWTRAPSTA